MGKSSFYTRTGDKGDTVRLAGSERVSKDSVLIEAVGAVDEATSAIGMARALCRSARLKETLPIVQRHIYRLMSHLSATPEARGQYSGLSDVDIAWLEALIAELEADLPALHAFVLPGETPADAALHVARTVVRRAERRLVALAEHEPSLGAANVAFLNRLSTLLFVAALHENNDGTATSNARRGPLLARNETSGIDGA